MSALYPTPKLLDEVLVLARAQLTGFLTALEKLDARLDREACRTSSSRSDL